MAIAQSAEPSPGLSQVVLSTHVGLDDRGPSSVCKAIAWRVDLLSASAPTVPDDDSIRYCFQSKNPRKPQTGLEPVTPCLQAHPGFVVECRGGRESVQRRQFQCE